jgi:hypothetical protein
MIISKKSNVANDPLFIRIQDNINTDTVAEFEKVLINCYKIKQKILPVVIDSHGGCPYSLISLYEIIKKSKIKISIKHLKFQSKLCDFDRSSLYARDSI